MPNSIVDKVKAAINGNIQARNLYNETMYQMSEKLGYSKPEDRNTKEKQILEKPASEEDIQKLESTIGIALPPSYRTFLQLHDGWKTIDGSPDLFSISQILDYMSSEDHTELLDNASIKGDDFVQSSLVIGASGGAPDRYLLNPNTINVDEEWEFVDYEKLEYEVYPSFLDFLVDAEKTYRDSISETETEEYFDPF